MTYSVNVRTVAEFALEGGDLFMDRSAVERMREGMEGHMRLQREMDSTWRTEEPVSYEIECAGIRLRVQGRADAVRRADGTLTVEEIKTTRQDPSEIGPGGYDVHWAQAEIYAAMLCMREGYKSAEVALVYYNLSGAKARLARNYTDERLKELFFGYALPYARWLSALEVWRGKFQPSVAQLGFPFDSYRDGQRQMAANAYVAARDHRRVMIEAPTGIGKTAAALFGALKAAGEGRTSAIFYLTARTTGRRAAENALELMRKKGLHVRSVTITAKEKSCVPGNLACQDCPYSAGYYDRRRAVLVKALEMERLGADEIRALADEERLCPFELSLDLSESADVIICDYNYAFDPRVRLQRFFTRKNDCTLLVDEAHNLPERARDMLSASLSGREIAHLRRDVGKGDPLYPALTKAARAMKAGEDAEFETLSRPPDNIAIAAEELADALTGAIPPGHPHYRRLVRLMLDATWYMKRHGEFSESESRALIAPDGKFLTVTLMCVDSSEYLDKCLKRVGGAAFFSATLTPAEFYARQLAVSENNGDALLSLPSPFLPDNQLTMLMPLATRFTQRENTLSQLCRTLRAMMSGRAGNYLACFPSHAYLNLAYERFRAMYPSVRCIRQEGAMGEEARMEFIGNFTGGTGEMLAFIALGGVFSEGVDLPGDSLIGAAIVSVGIPQICQERELIREINDDGEGGGYDFAYVYPGFRRVMQAAGRVIRTETDRGVVLLIDERFAQDKYIELMPPHWHVHIAETPQRVAELAGGFWK